MPQRLLVVSDYNHEGSSRPEAEIYLELARRGHRITVITHGPSVYVDRFRENNIRVLFGHPSKRYDPAGEKVIRKELSAHPYDAIILYNSRAIANGVRAARGFPVRVVVYRGYAGDLRWYDPSNYLKIYHPRVDAILCNNIGVQRHIQANRWWARRDITQVVNKGHDPAWYAGVQASSRGSIGVPEGVPMLVCVANAAKFKGVPYLLQAMALLDQGLEAHLVLCGHHMDTAAHRRLIDASPHPERIHVPGFRDDVFGIVKAADVKVLPSIHGESLTKAVFEAMALGTPVLITDIAGNEELVEHDVSGNKVPPRDAVALAQAIEALIRDPALRERLAAGALARLEGPLSHRGTCDAMEAFLTS